MKIDANIWTRVSNAVNSLSMPSPMGQFFADILKPDALDPDVCMRDDLRASWTLVLIDHYAEKSRADHTYTNLMRCRAGLLDGYAEDSDAQLRLQWLSGVAACWMWLTQGSEKVLLNIFDEPPAASLRVPQEILRSELCRRNLLGSSAPVLEGDQALLEMQTRMFSALEQEMKASAGLRQRVREISLDRKPMLRGENCDGSVDYLKLLCAAYLPEEGQDSTQLAGQMLQVWGPFVRHRTLVLHKPAHQAYRMLMSSPLIEKVYAQKERAWLQVVQAVRASASADKNNHRGLEVLDQEIMQSQQRLHLSELARQGALQPLMQAAQASPAPIDPSPKAPRPRR